VAPRFAAQEDEMKTLVCVLALLVASVAGAETVTLGAKACTRTQICFHVPNNAGIDIDYISDASQYGRLLISIDGDIYDSGLYVHPKLSAFTIYNAAGKPLSGSLSIVIVRGTKCVQSGRVCVFPKTVTLKGGTLHIQ
jgi:hypothetical protein